GAGAVYTYGSLYDPPSRAAIYDAGAEALTCVHAKGMIAADAIGPIEARRDSAKPDEETVARWVDGNPSSAGTGPAAALAAYRDATRAATLLYADDPQAAELVRTGATEVVAAVNRQAQ